MGNFLPYTCVLDRQPAPIAGLVLRFGQVPPVRQHLDLVNSDRHFAPVQMDRLPGPPVAADVPQMAHKSPRIERSIAYRFRQEGRLLARLDHPGIVEVFDMRSDGGRLFIVTEYVAGPEGEPLSLARDLEARGTLPEDEVRRLTSDGIAGKE